MKKSVTNTEAETGPLQQAGDAPPEKNGFWGLYFPFPEIIPPNVVGNFHFETPDDTAAPTQVESSQRRFAELDIDVTVSL